MVSYVFFLAKRMVFLEIGTKGTVTGKEQKEGADPLFCLQHDPSLFDDPDHCCETLRQMGFAPLPSESTDTYLRRTRWILEQSAPRDNDTLWATTDDLLPARVIVKELFQVDPSWVPVFFDNAQLPFWMGACTWLITDPETGWTRPVIQLRKSLKDRERLWGFYSKTEILAHELIHACRCSLPDSPFEEHFAYLSSPSRFRRYWGPLFSGTREQWLFCAALAVGFLGSWWTPWANLLPFGALLVQGVRLILRQRRFKALLGEGVLNNKLHSS